jgi:hypothetical protein
MRAFGGPRGVGLGFALLVCAFAHPALAAWPNAIPAQPLVQAPRVCALGVTNLILNRRCKVEDFAKLGHYQGHDWYYAFYGVRWADRHGRIERAYPIFFYLQKPATLRLGLWINDEPGLAGRWARTPPPRPIVIKRPDGVYLGMTLKAVRGQDVQRLFRLKPDNHWTNISVLYRSDQDNAVLDAVIPKRCGGVDEGAYDWSSFRFNLALKDRGDGAPCGVVSAAIAIKKDRACLADAALAPALPTAPLAVPEKPNSASPSLTSKAAATISPTR